MDEERVEKGLELQVTVGCRGFLTVGTGEGDAAGGGGRGGEGKGGHCC